MKNIFLLVALVLSAHSHAQQKTDITGTVTDAENGQPLAGVTILEVNTQNGTTADFDGNYSITVAPNAILQFSYIGYSRREIPVNGRTNIDVTLQPGEVLDEVIVTGVFDKRKRIDASVAISTISEDIIKLQAPTSAADLLKNIPGVFVNSSTGEVGNQVTVRGTPTANRPSGNSASGYFYVSMQEDGLPVTNVTGGSFGPDYFLRADVNIRRIEAVRGGSASITGSDAPGGLFNYVSKEGGTSFEGNASLKFGLEGDANPYYRTDLGFGGPMNKSGDVRYYIGGFYRKSDGARYPGYSMNQGGQVKGNIVKEFDSGKLKLYAKYLKDKNGVFDFLPYINFNNPGIVDGFENTDTFVGSGDAVFDYQYYPDGPVQNFDPKDLISNKDISIGLEWDQNFGDGWRINNNFKYSSKSSRWNIQYVLGVGPTGIDATGLPGIWGNIGANTLFQQPRIGTMNVSDASTGELLYQSTQSEPGVFNEELNNLPNDGFIFGLGNALDAEVNEIMEQFILQKRIGKTNLTLGAYFGSSKIDHTGGFAGQYLSTLENRPSPILVTVEDPEGAVTAITDPLGYKNQGIFYANNKLTNNRLDLFFGQTTPLSKKLTLDYGFRYNYSQFVGDAEAQSTSDLNFGLVVAGGYDGDPSTEYDNLALNPTEPWSYDRKYKSLAFSGALNYKFNEQQAIYGRFSVGKKAPDMGTILQPRTKESSDFLYLEPIKMTQAEIGYKAQMEKFNLYVTPFYSKISNLAESAFASDVGENSFYNTPPVYSEQRTIGVEVEGDIYITEKFNVRSNFTYQDPKSIIRRFWNTGEPGPDDDVVIEVTDAAIQLTPSILASVIPSYSDESFNASLSWRYVGNSTANANDAFQMPAYSQFDLILGYNISRKLSLTFNINNLFNELGITGWYPPGGFPASTVPESFTWQQRNANPNAIWGARTTQPRSYFLTLGYNF